MSDGAWVRSNGMKWDETNQAWENAWGSVNELVLYDSGDQKIDVTGGWTSSGYTIPAWDSYGGYNRGVTFESNTIFISHPGTGYTYALVGTANTIDFTKWEALHIYVSEIVSIDMYDRGCALNGALWSTKSQGSVIVPYNDGGKEGELTVDISSVAGNYYPALFTYDGGQVRVSKVWLTE